MWVVFPRVFVLLSAVSLGFSLLVELRGSMGGVGGKNAVFLKDLKTMKVL